jgi:mRNA interferase RelE/StbE
MYKIVVHKGVAKKLGNVAKAHVSKFALLLETLKTNPLPWRDFDLKRIEGTENTYRIRIGDYRIVYFIEKEKETIHILKFETREIVYKR